MFVLSAGEESYFFFHLHFFEFFWGGCDDMPDTLEETREPSHLWVEAAYINCSIFGADLTSEWKSLRCQERN